MIIKENTITEFIQHSTGFTISKSDLINGKVVVNNIEITSIEDWNKVTKSLIELQQENKELCNSFKKIINIINIDGYDCKNRNEFEKELEKILKEISFVLEKNKKYNLK